MNFLICVCFYICIFMYNNIMKYFGRKDVFLVKNNNFSFFIIVCKWLLCNMLFGFGREKIECFFVLILVG